MRSDGSSGASTKKFVLADRDGTLIVDKHYLSNPDQVELIPGVAEAIARMNQLGWEVICLSNQSGVGRGYFTEESVIAVNDRVQEHLATYDARVLEFYFCPDAPPVESPCRKPAPGMAQDAAKAFGFDLTEAVVVGDKDCDIDLGKNVGAATVLVRTGYGSETEREDRARPDFVIDSFADLPAILMELEGNHAELGTSR